MLELVISYDKLMHPMHKACLGQGSFHSDVGEIDLPGGDPLKKSDCLNSAAPIPIFGTLYLWDQLVDVTNLIRAGNSVTRSDHQRAFEVGVE